MTSPWQQHAVHTNKQEQMKHQMTANQHGDKMKQNETKPTQTATVIKSQGNQVNLIKTNILFHTLISYNQMFMSFSWYPSECVKHNLTLTPTKIVFHTCTFSP